ncbi:hypothetical protein L3X38_035644 [Prunus dulcis]|uniref:Uncharacterized protein n=1 Tax=Prunus dulcis TaxID=3755 RepID=A0AAD4VK28_PRUDU|nr:hypothetical protein L3X38_035644 [Prunus dulcis]
MASWVLLPVASVTGRCLVATVRTERSSSICVRSSLDTNVSDMSVNAPKGLFPPGHYRAPEQSGYNWSWACSPPTAHKKLAAQDYKECTKATNTTDELSLV